MQRIGLTETLQIRAPAGFARALNEVASRDMMSVSGFARRVLLRELREAGVEFGQPARPQSHKDERHA